MTSDGIEPPLSDLESEVLPLHHEAGQLGIRRRPVVRISGFHPGDPGSNPGGGGFCTLGEKTLQAGFEPAILGS